MPWWQPAQAITHSSTGQIQQAVISSFTGTHCPAADLTHRIQLDHLFKGRVIIPKVINISISAKLYKRYGDCSHNRDFLRRNCWYLELAIHRMHYDIRSLKGKIRWQELGHSGAWWIVGKNFFPIKDRYFRVVAFSCEHCFNLWVHR